jgi:hypothetical protein
MVADAVEIDAEGGLAVRLARQQVSNHRHVVAVDRGEGERWAAVELLHDGRDLEVRIDRRGIGVEPPARGHAIERRAEARVEDAGIGHVREGPVVVGRSLLGIGCKTNAKHDNTSTDLRARARRSSSARG